MWVRVVHQEFSDAGAVTTVETDEVVLLAGMLREALSDDIHTGLWGTVKERHFVFTVSDMGDAKLRMYAHSEELASLADQLEE